MSDPTRLDTPVVPEGGGTTTIPPAGGGLEHADELTLIRAMQGRREL